MFLSSFQIYAIDFLHIILKYAVIIISLDLKLNLIITIIITINCYLNYFFRNLRRTYEKKTFRIIVYPPKSVFSGAFKPKISFLRPP